MNTNQHSNVPADDESAAFHAQLNNGAGVAPLANEGMAPLANDDLPQTISGSFSKDGN